MNTINRGAWTLSPILGFMDQPQIGELAGILQPVIDTRQDFLVSTARTIAVSDGVGGVFTGILATVPAGRNWHVLGGVLNQAVVVGGVILVRLVVADQTGVEVWRFGTNNEAVSAFVSDAYTGFTPTIGIGPLPFPLREGWTLQCQSEATGGAWTNAIEGSVLIADLPGGRG